MGERKLLQQGWRFTLISGIGWLMDFGIYTWLSSFMGIPVMFANMLSSLPAITFVFVLATRHIFAAGRKRMPLWGKYAVYLLYQAVLVSLVSILAGWLYGQTETMAWSSALSAAEWKILVKCLITPITLCCNFIFMRVLAERI